MTPSSQSSSRLIASYRTRINTQKSHRQLALTNAEREGKALADARDQIEAVETAQQNFQHLAQSTQETCHKQVGRIISKCLSSVFEEPYEFKIEFDRKRGKTEAEFAYYKSGYRINPRVDSGGVMDIAALGGRLASLLLSPHQSRKTVFFDEPFLGLSEANLPRVSAMISTLAEDLDLQIVIVTHLRNLEVGKVVELGQANAD
jgi:AAA domain, putative AbiEii toxin, Type IV TA system